MSRLAPFALLALSILSAAAIVAGPLNPPAGPVASSYKTLAEVEPRIAVNAQNTPGALTYVYVIAQSGSYFLASNISVAAGETAILVNAPNVTLDLNGFHVLGATSTQPGIQVSGANCTLRNGAVSGFATGISGSGTNGAYEDLRISACTNGIATGDRCRLSRLMVRDAAPTGWAVNAGVTCTVEDCTISGSPRAITANGNAIIRGCNISGATTTCLSIVGGSLIIGNRCRGSDTGSASGTGLSTGSLGNRIDGNLFAFFTTGITITASPNTVTHNVFASCLTNVSASANNLVGPVIGSAAIATNTNPDVNYDN